jgi:hypothetical protein
MKLKPKVIYGFKDIQVTFISESNTFLKQSIILHLTRTSSAKQKISFQMTWKCKITDRIDFLKERQSEGNVLYQKKKS